jgi:LDH2 family malate/lactate/ureidoglycolate dehydrogenase
MRLIPATTLRDLVARRLQAAGAREADAQAVAAALVESDLLGHEGHGVRRVPQYLTEIRQGRIALDAAPELLQETPTTAVVDGHWCFGAVSGAYALDTARRKAETVGLSAVALRRGGHLGRLGGYVERAAAQGFIGIAVANFGRATCPPFGGLVPRFGTNPWAFAVPAATFPPLVLDFATTAVAWGRLHVAQQTGERLPEGWVTDRQGCPLTDPAQLDEGWMFVPFGGHKGAGLMFLADILGGALSGHGCTGLPEGQPTNGALFLVLDPGCFQPRTEFLDTMDRLFREVKATPPAPGFDEVLLPGERGWRLKEQRLREGIPVPEEVWEAIRQSGN